MKTVTVVRMCRAEVDSAILARVKTRIMAGTLVPTITFDEEGEVVLAAAKVDKEEATLAVVEVAKTHTKNGAGPARVEWKEDSACNVVGADVEFSWEK